MTWVDTRFERHLLRRLNQEHGPIAQSMYSQYVATRDKVLREITQIPAVEPNLSDHGPNHIKNVLDNVINLISDKHKVHRLTADDLYILAFVVVFHDVGNLFGRNDHNSKVGQVYDWARGTSADVRRERTLVIKAAQAHTGSSSMGDQDTLKEVDPIDHFDGRKIQLRSIAAILRLADELAEGPQRTTEFYRSHIGYAPKSELFHQYAACTNVAADRENNRVRLTYEVRLDEMPAGNMESSLTELIEFILHRVSKLDTERRYTRFYCPVLSAFTQTDVAINFTYQNRILPIDVRFQLDELVVPGETEGSICLYPHKCKSPHGIAADVITAAGSNGGQP